MADYNIYIHAISSGNGASNPTASWSSREDGGFFNQTMSQDAKTAGIGGGAGTYFAFQTAKMAAIAQNPDSLISGAFTSIAKAFPIVAAAIAVVKSVEAITDTAIEMTTSETGNHEMSVAWSNFKNGARLLFHPASSALEAFRTERQWQRQNQKLTQQRDLLGDSVINSYTGRGV